MQSQRTRQWSQPNSLIPLSAEEAEKTSGVCSLLAPPANITLCSSLPREHFRNGDKIFCRDKCLGHSHHSWPDHHSGSPRDAPHSKPTRFQASVQLLIVVELLDGLRLWSFEMFSATLVNKMTVENTPKTVLQGTRMHWVIGSVLLLNWNWIIPLMLSN